MDALRQDGDVLSSLVAQEENGAIVGHVLFSRLGIEGNPQLRAAALAPMAVRPDRQRRGIGGALIRTGLEHCRRLDLDAVVVLGHTTYYPRFGFSAALAAGLEAPFSGPHLMALALRDGVLSGRKGRLRYANAFGIEEP